MKTLERESVDGMGSTYYVAEGQICFWISCYTHHMRDVNHLCGRLVHICRRKLAFWILYFKGGKRQSKGEGGLKQGSKGENMTKLNQPLYLVQKLSWQNVQSCKCPVSCWCCCNACTLLKFLSQDSHEGIPSHLKNTERKERKGEWLCRAHAVLFF